MQFSDEFLKAYENARFPLPLDRIIQGWRFIVTQAVRGYGWSLDDYWYEVSIREYFEWVFANEDLAKFPEMEQLQELIHKLDDEFRSVLNYEYKIPWCKHWWDQHLPRYGRSCFVSDVKDFEFDIEDLDSLIHKILLEFYL